MEILVVEDNPADVFLIREAVKIHGLSANLIVLENGEAAVQWIDANERAASQSQPAAVVLDLNMPKKNGAEVLARIRVSHTMQSTPVILFTSSNSRQDTALADLYPHTRYLRKSGDFDEFMEIGGVLREVVSGNAGGARE